MDAEGLVEGEQTLAGKTLPRVRGLARLTVNGTLALLTETAVVGVAMPVVVAQTEVLSEF